MTAWTPPRLRADVLTVEITPQQANVLSGMCCGHTNQQIARRMDLSIWTVKTYAARLYAALDARDRAHAVALVLSGQVSVVVANKNRDPRHAEDKRADLRFRADNGSAQQAGRAGVGAPGLPALTPERPRRLA